ncbi:amino acid adenylation domain-containing protein [Actinosynnema sp. NPDC023587]|uniref:non-ribosomal peptide synthetase n=1 Tax=Actinosynnema sp. NPDC023587 TaxID=3154695 RepID=UPI0033F0E067
MSANHDIEDVYELTPIQQGLLFEQMARADAGVYIEQLVLTFDGTLHVDEFGRAWQRVVDRHPILRTSFHWRAEGNPIQVVHRDARMPLEVLDWQDTPVEEQRRELTAWLDRERVEGFPLDRAPLMRITVIRSGPGTWLFVWRLSHLLMDGWSFGLAVTEFIDHYRDECLGVGLPGRPMRPYRDYVAWWAGQDGRDAVEFWREELDGFVPPEPLRLGGAETERGRPTHGFVELDLSDLEPGVRELARTHQLTLNTVVQGAWLIVLAHHYGTTDVACGFTMAHRPAELPGSETILGPLIATMPVRERLEPTRAAVPWLRDLQVHIAAVRDHTTVPLFEVQRVLKLPLDVPLLESSVSYENMPMPDFALAETGMKLTGMNYDGRPHYPITMVIMPGDGMPLRVIYDQSRFSPDAAARFCDQLRAVLAGLATSPELTIGELFPAPEEAVPLPGAAERPSVAQASPLHATFAAWAARAPRAVATVFGDRRLTYRQVDDHATAIAERLVALGVAPGDRVGLSLERSDTLVAAMIGVFRAGAAYVPLDPALPARRRAGMIADAAVTAVVTATASGFAGPELVLDGELLTPAGTPLPEVSPDDPAYVLYTSGSTGRPKAVVVTHRNVQSLLAAGRDLFGFDDGDVWTFSHSFSFDYSVWEIWGALGNGGRLVVVPRLTVLSPDAYAGLVAAESVTVSSQTPLLFESFTAASGEVPALRHVFIGGDRLHAATVRPWFARHGADHPQVHNLYGVTEAAVVSTWHRITEPDLRADAPLPIGRALPNQRAYLLDDRGRPVPPGGRGRLSVAGEAVALGYHDREELTASRFGVEAGTGERVYHTGDVAWALPDGTLHFGGRDDAQVKVRGHRVELGEVEAVLRTHPAVAAVVATTRPDGAGSARILCHAVPSGEPVPEEEVRAYAARHLPEHMVPTALGWLTRLPTTAGGKVDVRALPELGLPAGSGDEPRTELERELSGIVAGLVSLPDVGVHEEFAGLGLHSGHVLRLMTILRSRWDVSVPLRELYVSPTVGELARLVERERAC